MDLIVPLIVLGLLLVFEPGNKELNEYCTKAVEEGTFDARIQCWNHYKDIRDIPRD